VACCKTFPFPGMVESSPLMVPQRGAPLRPATLALERCNTSASVLALCLSWLCSIGLNAPKAGLVPQTVGILHQHIPKAV
jgi:hypothetical protein